MATYLGYCHTATQVSDMNFIVVVNKTLR